MAGPEEKLQILRVQDAWTALFWDYVFHIGFRNKELFLKNL